MVHVNERIDITQNEKKLFMTAGNIMHDLIHVSICHFVISLNVDVI